jgi:hypothetical protein
VADHLPSLAFTASGARLLAWWRTDGTDRIMLSSQPAGGGAWSAPAVISDPALNARSPQVVEHQGIVYVVYEGIPATGPHTIIVYKGDGSDPFPRTIIATLPGSATGSPRITSEGGHLWVTWVDSGNQVGFAELQSGAWSAVQTEGYSGASDLEPARTRVRNLSLQ